MSMGEVIKLIQKMIGASFIKYEEHLYYFWREKLVPQIKNHCDLQAAQATTIKRSGVTTENLLHWHGTLEDALEEMDRQNSWLSDWEGIKISNNIDSFWGNVDKRNMSAAEGKLCCYCVICSPKLLNLS